MSSYKGFTLIELIVTVAVMAILATIAVPSFRTIIENNRVATQANGLLAAAHFARGEAVRRGVPVRLSGTGAPLSFDNGWCVHIGAACAGDDIIRVGGGIAANTATADPDAFVTFDRSGENAAGANFTLTVHPSGCSGDAGRARVLQVTEVGRASITTGDCPP